MSYENSHADIPEIQHPKDLDDSWDAEPCGPLGEVPIGLTFDGNKIFEPVVAAATMTILKASPPRAMQI